jgi:hypothetical protein
MRTTGQHTQNRKRRARLSDDGMTIENICQSVVFWRSDEHPEWECCVCGPHKDSIEEATRVDRTFQPAGDICGKGRDTMQDAATRTFEQTRAEAKKKRQARLLEDKPVDYLLDMFSERADILGKRYPSLAKHKKNMAAVLALYDGDTTKVRDMIDVALQYPEEVFGKMQIDPTSFYLSQQRAKEIVGREQRKQEQKGRIRKIEEQESVILDGEAPSGDSLTDMFQRMRNTAAKKGRH